MTPEFPALQQALVAAARRRIRRRRTFQVALPALVAAAAAATVIVSLPQAPPEPEHVAVAPKDVLARSFAAFRRPRTAADALAPVPQYPRSTCRGRGWSRGPGTRACTWCPRRSPSASAWSRGREHRRDCTSRSRAVGETSPLAISLDGWQAMFMPDGTRDVRITDTKGKVREVALHDNAALLARGAVHRARRLDRGFGKTPHPAPGDHQAARATPQGCPALQPLPADAIAQARHVALLAVDQLYPAIREATIGSAARATGTPCSAAITRQSIAVSLRLITVDPKYRRSASLSQGRLLLGMVGGRMTVYALQH